MLFSDQTPELNETDMIIYKYVMSHLDTLKKLTIRELSVVTHTSTASILRFCKKFGVSGYSEFKIKLLSYIQTQKYHSANTYTSDFENELINFLTRAKDDSYQHKIDEAVELLLEKELIVFIGVGSSNIVAEYGALYFSSLFNIAIRIEDPTNYPINYLGNDLARKMCVIALSVSGETLEIINYLNHLNLTACSVISITNNSKSTIAQLSDINIPYYVSVEKINDADITTQIPALFTIEKLAKVVRQQKVRKQNQL